MAYSKKIWKARQGLGLNKFSIDGATPVPITNQPDSVTQQGDALSAGNLNDLENRIANAFDDVENEKADKTEVETQIQILDRRVTNLEQVSGDYVTSDLQDYSSVPTGKATYALVETLKGVSRVENQLITEENRAVTVPKTTTLFYPVQTTLKLIESHKYLLIYHQDSTYTAIDRNTFTVIIGSATRMYESTAVNHNLSAGTYYWYFTANATGTGQLSVWANADVDGKTYSNITLIDLTLYFNGSIPSNADTVAHIAQYYPELLEPRNYNAGEIVDSTYTKVESRGVNIWDEHWKMGHLVAGQEVSDSTYKLISSDFSECMGGVTYYFNCGVNSGCTFYVFDKDKNYLGYDMDSSNHSSFTTRANARYFKIQLYSEYASSASAVYGNNIQFCLNSLPDAVKQTYHPYMTDQLAIPSVTLKGAGSVSEVYVLETGEVTHPIGEIDLGLQNWVYSTVSNNVYLFTCVPTKPAKNVPTSTDILNAVCASNKVKISAQYYWNTEPYLVSGYNDGAGRLLCTFTSNDVNALKTYLSGVMFDYELATPDPSTFVTPVLNNTLKTEGGGTVFTDADVDGQFTLGFLNL